MVSDHRHFMTTSTGITPGELNNLRFVISQSNEITWIVDLRPSGISDDRQINRWKDRVSTSTGRTMGELNDLRIVMS